MKTYKDKVKNTTFKFFMNELGLFNEAALEIIDKYHKIFTEELSTNITFSSKTKKFNLREYYNIIKKINIECTKELKMLEVKELKDKVKKNKKTFEETVVDLAS